MSAGGDPRLILAAEQNLLAWLRTGIALMGFGFVTAKFRLFLQELSAVHGAPMTGNSNTSMAVGVGLVFLGVAVVVLSAVVHGRYVRRLASGGPETPPGPLLAVGASLLVALAGVTLAVYLVGIG